MLPSDLQETLARHLDLPVATVAAYARRLREGGALSRGGRGQSAARMGFEDASSLLVAVAGSLTPSDGLSQLAAFDLTRLVEGKGEGVLRDLGLHAPGLSGKGAVARIVSAAASGELDKILASASIRPEQASAAFGATFIVSHPVRLQVRFSGYSGLTSRESVDYGIEAAAAPRMQTMRTIQGRALVSLGRALSS